MDTIIDIPTDSIIDSASAQMPADDAIVQMQTIDTTKTSENLDELAKNIEATLKIFKGYVSDIRTMKKEVQFLEKSMKKNRPKKNINKPSILSEDGSVEKRKNGFARPTDISNELAVFLGIEPGVQVARTEVTKKINAYVKDNNLQDKDKKKCILLDSPAGIKLKNLLTDIVDADGTPCDLNFINIQKYIKHHFPKKTETIKIEAPKIETINIEVPKTETIKTEVPKTENIKDSSYESAGITDEHTLLHKKKKIVDPDSKIDSKIESKKIVDSESKIESKKIADPDTPEVKKVKKLIKKRPIEEDIVAQ